MVLSISRTISANFFIRLLVFISLLSIYVIISYIWRHDLKFLNEVVSIVIFYSAYLITPTLRLDKISIVSPKNLMLLVFFMRLVVCPVTIFFAGQQQWKLPAIPTPHDLYVVHLITFLAFYSFVAGWDCVKEKSKPSANHALPEVRLRNNGILLLILLCCFLFVIFRFYGSFGDYFKSLFYEDYYLYHEGSGKLTRYLAILFRYGIPFIGIISGLFILSRVSGGTWTKAAIAFIMVLLILFLALGPSRNNMIFPSLAFLAACIPVHFRIRFRDFVMVAVGFLILLFLFQNFRKRGNEEMMEELNTSEKFIEFVQVYFVSPHIMTPLLSMKSDIPDIPFTLHASFLEPIPVLGSSFRDKSGTYFYNLAYGRAVGPDQVLPTYGEIYLNLGYAGVLVVFFVTGLLYRKIDIFFRSGTMHDPVLRSVAFYLTLLFNATIFYSYSVLAQFLFYNSVMVFAILLLRDKIAAVENKRFSL